MADSDASSVRVRFRCPNCHARLRARLDQLGKTRWCPRCNNRIDAPKTEPVPDDTLTLAPLDAPGHAASPAALQQNKPQRHEKARSPKSSNNVPSPLGQPEDDSEAEIDLITVNCDNCDQPLDNPNGVCAHCGLDQHTGEFIRRLSSQKKSKRRKRKKTRRRMFASFFRSIGERFSGESSGSFARLAVTGAVICCIAGSVGYFFYQRSTGGSFGKWRWSTISQMTTDSETRSMFGQPRERILIVSTDLGDDFLSLDDPKHVERIRAAKLDPAKYQADGYTMIVHRESKLYTMLMDMKHDVDYFLFYARTGAAMFVLLGPNPRPTPTSPEVCRMTAYLEDAGGGNFRVYCNGMGPIKNARGDVTGYGWQDIFVPDQTIKADAPSKDLALDPTACWNVLSKAKVKSFRY